MRKFQCKILMMWILLFSSMCYASDNIVINIYSIEKSKQSTGTVTAKDTSYGLLFIPDLKDLSPGIHGFHVHVNPSCDEHGMAAGGHLDPQKTNTHLGPYSDKGHLGDLPVLIADKNGLATLPVLAPRLKLKDIKNHSLMIHADSDNYADKPPMGGGGARVACGVIGQ